LSRFIDFFKIEGGDLIKPSVIILILANLVPLYGAIFLDWKVFPILLIFWLENVIIGVFNVLKMLWSSTQPAGKWGEKLFIIPFFCVHYGIFTLVHGIFIVVIFGGLLNDSGTIDSQDSFTLSIQGLNLVWAVLALLVSHTVSFAVNYIGKGEYKNNGLSQLMFQPYGRVVIMHLTIIAGGFLVMTLGAPVLGLIVLVLLKTVIDILAHIRQHKSSGNLSKVKPMPV
jgi:hypothetical protein